MSSGSIASFSALWGGQLWRASWQGGLAILAIWLLCRIAPRMGLQITPSQQRLLWRLPYLKLLVALVWIAPIRLPLLPPIQTNAAGVDLGDAVWLAAPSQATGSPNALSTAPEPSQYLATSLFALWAMGCLWSVVQILREAKESRRLRRECQRLEDRDLLAERDSIALCLGIGKAPPLLLHQSLGAPLLMGVFRPAIVLPASCLEEFDTDQIRLVLAHEMAHLRSADLWWAWLARLTRCLFFFHPLVWLAEREWLQTQEIACDALVLQRLQVSASFYGAMLLKIVQPPRRLPPVGLSAMRVAESYSTVKRRLIAMKQVNAVNSAPKRRLIVLSTLIGVAAVIGITPWRVVAQEASRLGSSLHGGLHGDSQDPTGLLTPKMIDALKLSETQVTKIRAAMAGAQEQINKTLTHGQKEQLASLAETHRQAMEKLALSPDQKAKVETMITQQEMELHRLHSDATLTEKQREERMNSLKKSHEAEMKKILTPAQLEKLKAVHAEVDEELKAAPTEEQRQQVAELHMRLQQKLSAINNDASLTQEQREQQIKQLHELAETQMSQIMTDAQRKHRAEHHSADGQVKLSLMGLLHLKSLTPEQKAKIEAAYENAHKQIAETLTPAQRDKLKEMHSAQ